LGLSLVQAVAKLHGSSLQLSDQNPGLRAAFTVAAESMLPPSVPAGVAHPAPAANRQAMA
jgi:hypothetical protein